MDGGLKRVVDLFKARVATDDPEEADEYRFAVRKLNQLWRGYNEAFSELNSKSAALRVAVQFEARVKPR
jgi:hypothetical protein